MFRLTLKKIEIKIFLDFFKTLRRGLDWVKPRYFLAHKSKFRQKVLVKKSKFVWRIKNHPDPKYSVIFLESRNKKEC